VKKYYGLIIFQQRGRGIDMRITKTELEHLDLLLDIIFTEDKTLIQEEKFP
jgi:hypothetical protein